MMEIKMLQKDKKSGIISFMLVNSNPSFANAMRRNMMESVPTMAIEDVEFRKNSSVLYDEIVAHRLGLIPLTTDLKSYTLPKDCKCKGEGCARCTLKLTLKSKGTGYVYASEFKSKDPKVKPVYGKTPIVKLIKGQELELEATAVLGLGSEHAKWSACHVWHTYEPKITVNNSSAQFEKFKDNYPPQAFDKSGKLSKDLIMENNVVDACDGVCEDIVKVEYNNKNFIFYVEPWGQLGVKEIASKAADIFKEQIKEFEDSLKQMK